MTSSGPASSASPDVATHPAASSRKAFDPAELLKRVWRQNLPMVRDRVSFLEAAAQDAQNGVLSADQRAEAGSLAHKLAGSLGMFGYHTGTEVARELEVLLDASAPLDGLRFAESAARLRAVLPLND